MQSGDEDDRAAEQAGTGAGDAPTTPGQAGTPGGASGAGSGPAPPHELGPPPHGAAPGGPPPPRRLYRSREERMIGGVCGGLAQYFGIDPVIVRVAAVALVFAGGAGILAYVAAWLLVPEQGAGQSAGPGRVATIVGAIALVLAIGSILPFSGGPGWDWGGFTLCLVVLGLAGLGVWWMASGEHPSGSAGDIVRRAALGVGLIALCGVVAIGGTWATATGGGTFVAGIVVVAGLWILAGAFFGGARWLILPALALALPAGVVSAANINVDGGVGDRRYRPAAPSEIRDGYRVGAGRLVLDLRDAHLTPRDRRVHVEVGVGEAVVVVAPDVCVASRAQVGVGQVAVFDRDSGGVDVSWQDDRTAPPRTARLVVDARMGAGALTVTHRNPDAIRGNDIGRADASETNRACAGGANG